MSSQDGQQNEQNQISPHNQSAKTSAGAAIGALIMFCEYAWDGIKALWKAVKEKTPDSKQKEEKNCNEKPITKEYGNQQTKDKVVDGKQEPKTEKTEEKTDVKNNKQTTAGNKAQGNNSITGAFKGNTGPSDNQGIQASALPSNNNSPSVGGGRG